MSLVRLVAVMRKEFIQVLRDRTTLRLVILMPLIMMMIFGYVVNTDIKSVPAVVSLQDNGAPARELFEKFRETGFFSFVRYVGSASEVGQAIGSNEAKVGVVIPPDYSERIQRGETAEVQVLIDGSDPLVSRQALSTAEMLGQITGSTILTQRLQKLAGSVKVTTPVEVRGRVWYNPNMESVKFNMPGLIGAILQNIVVMLIAGAMVREREKGTMEQLIVTPVRSAELILGKMAPYVIIAIIDVIIVLLVGVFWFKMTVAGSLLVFALNCFIFLLSSLGMGLLLSTMAQNQVQANQLSQLVLLPSLMLSGYMFPRESMPAVLQGLGSALPLTYFLQVLRGVFLKGIGLEYLWRQAVAMCIQATILLSLAVWRLRKRLD